METVKDLRNKLTTALIAITQDQTKDAKEMYEALMAEYEKFFVIYEKMMERDEKMIADLNKLLAQKEENQGIIANLSAAKIEKEALIANISAAKIEKEALIAAKNEENAKLSGALAEQQNKFNVLFASVGSGIIVILLMNLFPKKKN